MTRTRIAAAIFAFGLAASPTLAATTVDRIFAFGDSLNDCCRNGAAPFTNGPETWLPAFSSAVGGTYAETLSFNYAVGGAQTGPVNAVPSTDTTLGYPTGFTSQAARFKDDAPATDAHDLGIVWVGTNDIWASANESDLLFGALSYNRPVGKQPAVEVFVDYAVSTLRSGIDDLVAGGIEKLLILTPYDMANSALLDSPGAVALGSAYSRALRDALTALYTPGIDTWTLDMVTVLETAQPGFLFKTAAEPCPTPTDPTGCDDYVFIDFVHLTTSMNAIVSTEAASLVMTTPPIAPIPLPGGLVLLLGGLAGVGVLRLRAA